VQGAALPGPRVERDLARGDVEPGPVGVHRVTMRLRIAPTVWTGGSTVRLTTLNYNF
jgi:hypothetical protein